MQFPDLVPHVLVMLTKRGVAVIGEREARLLDAVDRVRSIKDAAAEAGISYRTAWSAIQQMEQALGRPMVVSRARCPGSGAGPVIVTPMAESSPELGDVSRTFSSPGPETLVESPPQLNPTAITPASNAAPKSRFIAGLLSAAAPALQARSAVRLWLSPTRGSLRRRSCRCYCRENRDSESGRH